MLTFLDSFASMPMQPYLFYFYITYQVQIILDIQHSYKQSDIFQDKALRNILEIQTFLQLILNLKMYTQ